VTGFNERRRERLHLELCEESTQIRFMYPMGDDTFLIEKQGEISLLDGASLKSLLKQLAGKDVLP
jgi:hypothetical protein